MTAKIAAPTQASIAMKRPGCTPGASNLTRPLPPFAALKAFEAVGRHGGIRKAGLALKIDHAVVSRHLRQLEKCLGVVLTCRVNGETRLSPSGLQYHARISAAMSDLAAATDEIIGSEEQRRLKIWCVPGLATQWLTDRLDEFTERWPDYDIELRPSDHAPNFMSGEADVDIRFFGDTWAPRPGGRGLRFIELARPKLMAVASPSMAATLVNIRNPRELLEAPLLHEENDEQWRAWLRKNGVSIGGGLGGQILWHAHLAIAAAKKGRGIALASSYLVGRDLSEGSLVEVATEAAHSTIIGSYAIVAREEHWSRPGISRLRHFLQSKTQ